MSKYSTQLSKNLSAECVVYSRRKQHGKFRYWTNRKHKDQENIRRIQNMLNNERSQVK